MRRMNGRFDDNQAGTDEESKTEDLSERKMQQKEQEIAHLKELARVRTETLEMYIEKLTNDQKMK